MADETLNMMRKKQQAMPGNGTDYRILNRN